MKAIVPGIVRDGMNNEASVLASIDCPMILHLLPSYINQAIVALIA
jgi:hypothetical protein